MLDHVSLGARDIATSRAFYDATQGALNARCLSSGDSWLGYGTDQATFWVLAAESPVPADPRSGLHFCFKAGSREAVDAFYRNALATGGKDNGPPGIRGEYSGNYYAAFVVDPDGYRLEAYFNAPA